MAAAQAVSSDLTVFGSRAGVAYFSQAHIKQPYWQLSRYFTTQKGLSYCGVASSVMVLNALGKAPESSPTYYPYRLFDQDNIFYHNAILSKVITPTQVHSKGMTLAQLAGVLGYYGVKTTLHFGSAIDKADDLRNILQQAMTHGKYVIVNYDRQALGQAGRGHISPIAAYHQGTDRWLVLDVARYKYPPVWVKTADLLRAIKGIDAGSQKSRGLVVVSN